jgi:hypothetical protein
LVPSFDGGNDAVVVGGPDEGFGIIVGLVHGGELGLDGGLCL